MRTNSRLAFVSLENMKGSDLNYLVQVKVTSQHLEANNLNQIRKIPGIKPSDFTEVYGDSFVSGFIEGGEFTALLSIKVDSLYDIPAVRLAIQLAFTDMESGENASGQFDLQKLIEDGKVSVLFRYFKVSFRLAVLISCSVAWIGDTTQDPADIEWTIEEVRLAAMEFPQKVALYPQRTQ